MATTWPHLFCGHRKHCGKQAVDARGCDRLIGIGVSRCGHGRQSSGESQPVPRGPCQHRGLALQRRSHTGTGSPLISGSPYWLLTRIACKPGTLPSHATRSHTTQSRPPLAPPYHMCVQRGARGALGLRSATPPLPEPGREQVCVPTCRRASAGILALTDAAAGTDQNTHVCTGTYVRTHAR